MKTIYQILIIAIISASLFLAKEDFIPIYNKGVTYINNSVLNILNKKNDKFEIISNNNEDNEVKDNINDLPKKIETPGALKVLDKVYLPNISDFSNSELSSKNIIEITNKYRKENGNLDPLEENQKLNFSAQKKLEDMFANQYFEHLSPDNVGVSDLALRVSYEYITVGENLAMGNFNNDKALVDAWMASPGHRENILNQYYTEIGVAVGEGIFEGKKVWMAVQHFGLPKTFCPEINQLLRGVIDLEEKQIKKIEADLAIRRQKIEERVVYEDLTTNEQISKYNGMIVVYNQLVFSLKEKIDTYNKQVKDFNSCLAENTTHGEE
jgi:uncharacterized protein YkwD